VNKLDELARAACGKCGKGIRADNDSGWVTVPEDEPLCSDCVVLMGYDGPCVPPGGFETNPGWECDCCPQFKRAGQ
jgi:hypothetical protein